MQSACIRGKEKSIIKRSWTVAAPRSTYTCSVIWPYQLSKERLLDIFDRIGTSRHRFSRRPWIMNIWMTLQQKAHLNTMYVGADMVNMDMLMVSYNHIEQSTPFEATKMDSNSRWNTAHCLSSSLMLTDSDHYFSRKALIQGWICEERRVYDLQRTIQRLERLILAL